jgi:hypothetical protein
MKERRAFAKSWFEDGFETALKAFAMVILP